MSALPTVYLARHGETEWSKSGQHTGRTDLPLTATGEASARVLGTRLARFTFDHLFTSPRSRARRTAELAGYAPEVDPDLQEWDYGDFEGLKSAEIAVKRPGWNLFRDGAPGGESPEQVSARADRLVNKLKGLNGNVICFAHGHILRVIAARWIGYPVTLATSMLLDTGSLSILGFNHHKLEEPAIRVWNS
ncbi:histidine phosphatase family protein [Frigoriglobus tundricola]|uniref:Phosphoserine phosphatase 2 n=1 Tax=Frigoriglobus tundricola TaxID=2774151 RepID=A0A6M5YS75_9BACT|nr:histidine phosphatase family protein [Frigoriglobus tundricola]QJW96143.1 Putative phosphoserine phosphatase 2 [Frigoriglobus tundricola]